MKTDKLSMLDFTNKVQHIGGWLTKEEGLFLYNSAKDISADGKIVEIGSWKGRSTICIGQGSKDGQGATIYAIDPHTGSPEIIKKIGQVNTYVEFLSNIKKSGIEKYVTPIREKSEAASHKIKSTVSLIFVDGAHDFNNVKRDFALWFPKLIAGGKIVFHDSWHAPGVHLFTVFLLLSSRKVKNPRLLDTMTILEKTPSNSIQDMVHNWIFAIYRVLVGWMGTIRIDRYGTVTS